MPIANCQLPINAQIPFAIFVANGQWSMANLWQMVNAQLRLITPKGVING